MRTPVTRRRPEHIDDDPLQLAHWIRCGRKLQYSKPRAYEVAKRATRRTGTLIVPYECFDCARWHIGHAPESEQIEYQEYFAEQARKTLIQQEILVKAMEGIFCKWCTAPIPLERTMQLLQSGVLALPTFCSKECRVKWKKQ